LRFAANPGKQLARPYLKKLITKRAVSVAQVVELLNSKREVLSLNPNAAKKREKRKKKNIYSPMVKASTPFKT
jgi:hypothetical protein